MSITYLYGEGGFLSKKKKIIYCITNPFIYSKLKRVILSVDPNAIMEATYVCETSGLDSSLIEGGNSLEILTIRNPFADITS